MIKNIVNKWVLKTAHGIEGQTYSDNFGEWHVPDLIAYCYKNKNLQEFEIEPLAQIAFQRSSEETFDEVPGSPEFVQRAERSSLIYPIIVVRYEDGDFIADGNHRLWKARAHGMTRIWGYLLTEEELHTSVKTV